MQKADSAYSLRSTQKPQWRLENHSGAYLPSSAELWLEQAPRLWLWTPLLPGSLSLHKTSAGQTWVRKISQRQTFGLTLDITSRHTGTYQAEPPLPLPLECLTQDGLDPDIMDSSV